MADHGKFNKITKKLHGRQFKCKTFYDVHFDQVVLNKKNGVYLMEEVDEVIENLRKMFEELKDELVRKEKIAYNLEIENFALKRRKKKNEGTDISIDSPPTGQTSSY